jgi:hypothetical protein
MMRAVMMLRCHDGRRPPRALQGAASGAELAALAAMEDDAHLSLEQILFFRAVGLDEGILSFSLTVLGNVWGIPIENNKLW